MKKMYQNRKLTAVFGLLLSGVFVWTVTAGDLNPPASPGAGGTMKTLDEVRPGTPIPGSETAAALYTISEPGTYYLTGNRMVSHYGVSVQADNVTIDLGGFELYADANGANYGIQMAGRRNVTIKNGTVRGFNTGIEENNITDGHGHRLIDVRVLECVSTAVQLQGDSHQVIRCSITDNSGSGLWIPAANSMIKDCILSGNGGYGIYANDYGVNVVGNVCSGNDNYGICAGQGCMVKDNICYDNGSSGVYAYYGSVIKNNTCYQNANNGINAYTATVIGNNVYMNQNNGIYVGSFCLIDQNSAHNNNQSGGSYSDIVYNVNSSYGTNYPNI